MRKENLLGDTERVCLENGEKGECVRERNDVCDQVRAIRKNGLFSEL